MKHWFSIAITAALALTPQASLQAQAAHQIITNANLDLTHLPLNKARSIFSMRLHKWPDGTPIRVYVLPDDNVAHREFVQSVLRMFPHQLRRNWDRYIYTGTGQAPIEVSSEAEMIKLVSLTPGAIGYTQQELVSNDIHTIQLR
mgnify:CR=1 FL=1